MKIDAYLITDKSNIAYLSNFTGSSGFMLLTKKKNYLFTDFRYIERAKKTIKKGITIIDTTRMWRNPTELKKNWQKILSRHRLKNIGIEEDNLTVSRLKRFKKISHIPKQKIKFIDISGYIEKKRMIKSSSEIAKITKSQRINEKTFLTIKKIIQEHCRPEKPKFRLTEKYLAWKIIELGHQFGADTVSFDPIVAFGQHSALPHHEPDNTVLKKGDLVLIDMGMKYQGYCSDMTRVIFTATPSPKQKLIYNLVLQAQKAAIKKIRSSLTGKQIDNFSRSIIKKAGFGDQYGHAGGHGIGLDIHEIPSLSESYPEKIPANTVITIEPGIYLPGEFGIRIEDMVIVKANGHQNLTKIKK